MWKLAPNPFGKRIKTIVGGACTEVDPMVEQLNVGKDNVMREIGALVA